jgi:hypothetical protein
MFRVDRVILIASLLSFGVALSSCADFDPDKLDIFGVNEKKKLPGERRALFPEGVPGVTQGVPPDLIKGHQQAVETEPELPPVAAEKPKPKPRTVRRAPAQAPTHAPARAPSQPAQAAQPKQQLEPWPSTPPAQSKQAPQQAQQAPQQAPWPAPQPAKPATPWPDPPPAGTFTR